MAKGPIVNDVENAHRETAEGHEILDNSPVAIPLRFKRVDAITQKVQELVQSEFSRLAEKEGYETFAEADDFDVGDDYDPQSPYELDAEQEYYDHRNERAIDGTSENAERGSATDGTGVQEDRETVETEEGSTKSDQRNAGRSGGGNTDRKGSKKIKASNSVKGAERSVP